MIQKKIGSSEVPAIGQGTGGIYNPAIIRGGIGLGLTLIDTAESYNNEDIIGQAIKGIRDKVFISTKFSPEHNAYDDVIKSCEGSLERLNTDYIDLYLAHYRNPYIPEEETLKALDQLRAEGKIRYIGICNTYNPTLAGRMANAVQVEYNLFDRTPEESLLPRCEQNEIALLAYSPIRDYKNLNPESMIWLADIEPTKTLTQKILNWLISYSPVIVLTSSSDISHLKKNALAGEFTMSDDVLNRIDKLFKPNIIRVPLGMIDITLSADKFPQTKEEAMLWRKWVVKPQDLDLADFKPIKLVISSYDRASRFPHTTYEVKEGGLRYWAWVIQRGTPVPAVVKSGGWQV